jgi:hypothetical protein
MLSMRSFGLILTGLFFGLAGCSNYHLGTGAQPKFSRLYIAPVASETLIPQAQAIVATQVREAFLKDGRVTLADSPGNADAVLKITLSSYHRNASVALTTDTALARRFDVTLAAKATLTLSAQAEPAFKDRPLVAERGVFTDSGQQQAEYQNVPLLAEILADQAVHAVLDTW